MTWDPARLVDIGDLAALDDYHPHLVEVVRDGLAADQDPLAISGSIADLHDALTDRLLLLAEDHLGPPPCRYAWLALGSHGRREQVLSSDQDSAIAYESSEPDREVSGYFADLAGLVVSALTRAGMPPCDGGYMATHWHRPLDDYAQLFRGWVENPDPLALLRAEVFLDVRRFRGDLTLDTLERILASGGGRGPFVAQMAAAAVHFRPPLGLFGRLGQHQGTVDVKRGGSAAIVLLARLYALIAGSPARSTIDRLGDAATADVLHRQTADDLIEGYRMLTGLRLRHQLDQVDAGHPIDNVVRVADWPASRVSQLRSVLRNVRDIQDLVSVRYATHTLS